MRKFKNTLVLLVSTVALVACQSVTPEQAVNISEVHDAIVRLMPHAEAGIRAEIAALTSIAGNADATDEARTAAETRVVELTGRLLETRLLPEVSAPIRDWAIAKVGTETFVQAKAERDHAVTGGN